MDTNERIRNLIKSRGWTSYRLAKEAGLSLSTVSNIFERNTVPTIATLEAICRAFGITVSQFFSDDDTVVLSKDLRLLFEKWVLLSPSQKAAILDLMQTMQS